MLPPRPRNGFNGIGGVLEGWCGPPPRKNRQHEVALRGLAELREVEARCPVSLRASSETGRSERAFAKKNIAYKTRASLLT